MATGTVAVTETDDVLASGGGLGKTGTVAVTESPDTTTAAGGDPPTWSDQLRFLFLDTLTQEPVTELILVDYEFGQTLTSIGTLKGRIKIPGGQPALRVSDALQPVRRRVQVIAPGPDPLCLWDGYIWARPRYDRATLEVELAAAELRSMFSARYVTDDLSWTGVYPAGIVSDLVAYAQGHTLPNAGGSYDKPNGDIGIDATEIVNAGGATIDLTITAEEARNVNEFIDKLARDGSNGDEFDFGFETLYEGGAFVAHARVWAPRRQERTDWVWETGRTVETYETSDNATAASVRVVAVGADTLRSTRDDTAALADGMPLIERMVTYKSVDVQASLDALADYELGAYSRIIDDVTVEYPYYGNLPAVGDTGALVILGDPMYSNGVHEDRRVISWTLSSTDAGPPRVRLVLADATVRSRPPVRSSSPNDLLKEYDTRLVDLETLPTTGGGGGGGGTWSSTTPCTMIDFLGSPSPPNFGTNNSAIVQWTTVGKLCIAQYFFDFGGTGIDEGVGAWGFDLPVAKSGGNYHCGSGQIWNGAGTDSHDVQAVAYGSTSPYCKLWFPSGTSSDDVGAGAPWTWTSGAYGSFTISYRTA